MRGEKSMIGENQVDYRGSPPRARGKAHFSTMPSALPGITPACAGKSQCHQMIAGFLRDHPRVRGEKSAMLSCRFAPQGSPPHVRGKVHSGGKSLHAIGITPACAGKSAADSELMLGIRDHPRVCGEKNVVSVPALPALGSPPRVRGKAEHDKRLIVRRGITPARAGKRRFAYISFKRMRDHPRACGEKIAE